MNNWLMPSAGLNKIECVEGPGYPPRKIFERQAKFMLHSGQVRMQNSDTIYYSNY